MKNLPRMNATVWALGANAVLLLCILLVLLAQPSAPRWLPAANAQPPAPIAGSNGLFIMPAQFSTNTWGCYVLDTESQTLCAYQFYPGDKLLRLAAARNFRYDRQLGNFNTAPAPAEVAEWLFKEQQTGGRAPGAPQQTPAQDRP